ncbi:MAG TPA: hypothetical protein VFZ34_17665 [Blastocatellia bacterium]|nr:hypothetical protein [Blastocatellia bacterium]
MNHLMVDVPDLFSQFTQSEQKLLIPKLLRRIEASEFTAAEHAQAATLLNALLHDETQPERTSDKLLTLRNFTRQVGAMPAAWQQVSRIVGVTSSYLEITVYDHQALLATLKAEGYAVNSWMERVSHWVGHGHRFDSARALTKYRHDPQLHFVNDRADEADYGPNYFFVHWDAQSVYAERGSLLGRIVAGRTHAHQCATPQEVDKYLNHHDGFR